MTQSLPVLQTFLLILNSQFQGHYSLQNYFCNATSTCQDLTLNFSDPNDSYILTCEGYFVCKNTIVVISSSNDLSFDFTLNCLEQFACDDTIVYSQRQTNIYCGSVGSNDGSRCRDMKIHLTAPENSTNIIYSLGDDDSLSRSDFFCAGDATASCGMIFNGASQFNELYCLGSVASNAYSYTFCLTNCSYESIADNSTDIDRCDTFTSGTGWLTFGNEMYCDSTTQNCIANGGERETNYFDTTVTRYPSNAPYTFPTSAPTSPTTDPTAIPSNAPTLSPTLTPAQNPTTNPSTTPTSLPVTSPSNSPTTTPLSPPTLTPSTSPSITPSTAPTHTPTVAPLSSPTLSPSHAPTVRPPPTNAPTQPSNAPTTTNEKTINILKNQRNILSAVIAVMSVVICLLAVWVCLLLKCVIRYRDSVQQSIESHASEILAKNHRTIANGTRSNYNYKERHEDVNVAIDHDSTGALPGESIVMSEITNQ